MLLLMELQKPMDKVNVLKISFFLSSRGARGMGNGEHRSAYACGNKNIVHLKL